MIASRAGASNCALVLLSTLHELDSACPVVSTTQVASTYPDTPACWSTGGYRGWTFEMTWTGSSTWSCRNVSPVTGPVPPTTPPAMPPSTPLPVKSAALKRSFRLTGGMSLGISVGGITVWKPSGGGLAVTIASGGGASGGGGGGGVASRKLVVSCKTLVNSSAAPLVAVIAAYPITRCSTT